MYRILIICSFLVLSYLVGYAVGNEEANKRHDPTEAIKRVMKYHGATVAYMCGKDRMCLKLEGGKEVVVWVLR